jgi:protein-disulfide isomerase
LTGGREPDAGRGRLGSAPVPPLRADDHVRGPADGPVVIVYADFECPFCAVVDLRLRELPVRAVFRHFPVRTSHPRALAAACAAEAAARQQSFWPMHDSLFADQGRLEDPHLWRRAQELGLDLVRFEADRRSDVATARVTSDFREGIRGGVATTPTLFVDGERYAGRPDAALWERLSRAATAS